MDLFPPAARVLEVGAGSGWQARLLADQGFEVEAVDVASSEYLAHSAYPVRVYDGKSLPFPDASFDVVFSSNVLEHIPWVEPFQSEVRRVLRPGGVALHILPSASWRIWTSLMHYVWLAREVMSRLLRDGGRRTSIDSAAATPAQYSVSTRSAWRRLAGLLWSPRHGEHGNALSEVWMFSRFRWIALFRRAGFSVSTCFGAGVFHTGYMIAGIRLPIGVRRRLARIAGSSCLVYRLERD
jgi:SAM-dependent methyltransferase